MNKDQTITIEKTCIFCEYCDADDHGQEAEPRYTLKCKAGHDLPEYSEKCNYFLLWDLLPTLYKKITIKGEENKNG